MLLQRISLQNFLSHRGVSNRSAKLAPVEIDFRVSPLWLIYGPNGSGKSSIFDAITFALFKKHRGSGSTNHAAGHLITDGENEAKIELEIVLNGKSYLIQRELKRKKKSPSEADVSGIVLEWNGKDWVAVKNTKNNIEDWVQKNLRMGSKTFTSAVLLQQGEADAFLKAKPKDRKERLLEILDLDFYKRLGETAASKRTLIRNECKQIEQKISTTKKVEQAEVDAQNRVIKQVVQDIAKANKLVSNKQSELRDAERAIKIQQDIKEKEKDKKQAEKLIAREEQIVTNVKRYRELMSDVPIIKNILEIQSRIEQEINEQKDTSESIKSNQLSLKDISAQVKVAQKDTKAAETSVDNLRRKLEEAQADKDTLKAQVNQITQIEDLENLLTSARSKLAPYQDILKHADQLDSEKQRYDALRDILPILDDLFQARARATKLDADKSKFESESSSLTEQINVISSQHQLEQKRVLAAKKTCEKISSSSEKTQIQIAYLQDQIKARDDISRQKECPVCGSPLDTHEAHLRIDEQIQAWQSELAQWRKESKVLAMSLKDAVDELTSAESSFQKLESKRTKLETNRSVLTSKIDNSAEQGREIKRQIKKLEARAGTWSEKADNLETLNQEFVRLSKNSKLWDQLDRARTEIGRQEVIIAARAVDLQRLPKWTDSQREKIKFSYEEKQQFCTNIQVDLKQAEKSSSSYQRELVELKQQEMSISQEIEHLSNNLQRSTKRHTSEAEKLSKKLAVLPERLTVLLTKMNTKELARLEREMVSLSSAENDEAELRQARKQVDQLEGNLTQLGNQLQEIPKEHKRPVDKVRAELEVVQNEADMLQANLNLANEELGKMRSAQEEYERHKLAYEAVQTKVRYYDKLSAAFGRSGLQAQIVQEAQKRIKEAANTTLGFLSNGSWKIELAGDDQELEILAQDLSKPGLPTRRFEYLSGGEKFRVAISLAVAIGQSISGGRTVDTLIIDEGFGSLDEVNRDNLVAELRRLSDEVLNGGRVIIVSHEEDICEEFAHRFRISKNADGFVLVEKYLG